MQMRVLCRRQAWGFTTVHGARQQDVRASSYTGSQTYRLITGGHVGPHAPSPDSAVAALPSPLWAHGHTRVVFPEACGRRLHTSRPSPPRPLVHTTSMQLPLRPPPHL